jgi:hypothetical protein
MNQKQMRKEAVTAREYVAPKVSMLANAIELSNLADRIAEAIEKDGFGRASLLMEELNALAETLDAQLETH